MSAPTPSRAYHAAWTLTTAAGGHAPDATIQQSSRDPVATAKAGCHADLAPPTFNAWRASKSLLLGDDMALKGVFASQLTADNQRVHFVGSFVCIHCFQIGKVAHRAIVDTDAVSP